MLMQDRHFRFGLKNSCDSDIRLTLDWGHYGKTHYSYSVSMDNSKFNTGDDPAMDKNPLKDERGVEILLLELLNPFNPKGSPFDK